MNREIKFRCWDKVLNKMHDIQHGHTFMRVSDGWEWAQMCIEIEGERPNDPKQDDFVIMQYTGLKDKNDKEIYEGDIIKCLIDDEQHIFPIEWNVDKESSGWEIGRYTECEIIGNIYEKMKVYMG